MSTDRETHPGPARTPRRSAGAHPPQRAQAPPSLPGLSLPGLPLAGGEPDGRPAGAARPDPRDLLVAVHADPGIGRAAACRLGQEVEAWGGAGPPSLSPAGLGVPAAALERARQLRPRAAERAGEERRRAAAGGGRLVTRLDPDYPRPLLDLPLAPPVLAVAGEIPPEVVESGLAVALVGSRRADAYGLEVAADLARGLGAAGLPVVSGFARGVDTAAHRGVLDGGGSTVAVLGCGLDVDYPRGHRPLFRRVAGGGGAVVSELPCGAGPKRWHFPVRNRLIAALSLGTLVVRAAARSGSLITARHALDLGREVLAVPGPIFDRLSAGPNRLLADGAAVATSARDVLEALLGPSGALGLLQRAAEREAERAEGGEGGDDGRGEGQDGAEAGGDGGLSALGRPSRGLPAKLLAALPVGRERSPEALAADLEAGVDAVLGALLELELAGWVRRMPGPTYARRAGTG